MPPKSKTLRQKSKTHKRTGPNSGGRRKSQDTLERSTARNSTVDPVKQTVNKELQQREKKEIISNYQEQLDSKQTENVNEVKHAQGTLIYLRRDNDRMQRRQMAEYGMTIDMLEDLKISLDATKTNNDKLYEDMLEAKDLHDKLEIELKETKRRFSDAAQKINALEKESKVWTSTNEQYLKSELRFNALRRSNKKLKILLMKHHINPDTDPREFSGEVSHSDKQSYRKVMSYPESPPPRKLTVRSRYKNLENVEMMKQLNEADIRRGMGVLSATFDQVSPAYLGYYMKKRVVKKEQVENYIRSGTNLPRIIYGK